jgi:DNA polymerase III subunit gamma/tau
MGSQVFYRKWRPQSLADLAGQDHVTQTLSNALKSGHVSHAYLFCGPRGTGKTSTARILAKAVNCLTSGKGEPCNTCRMCQAVTEGRALDVIEIDAASNTGVDNIRDLREKVNYAPNEARYKVYIIDEVHMLSTSASNALLKTLEEPPPHAIFILATTETHKVLPTIISRCQRFDFHRLSQIDVVKRLTQICTGEGIKVPDDGLKLMAKSATGSLRDAINLLEQMTTFYGTDISLAQIKTTLGITGDARSKELVKHIVNNDITAGIKTIHDINNDGLDLKQFARDTLEQLRGLLLVKTNASESASYTAEDMAEMKNYASRVSLYQILNAVKVFSRIEIGLDNYSTLPLELAVLDSIQTADEPKTAPVPRIEPVAKPVTAPPPVAHKPQPVKTETADTAAPGPHAQTASASAAAVVVHTRTPPSTPAAKENPKPASAASGNDLEKLKQNWKQMLSSAPRAGDVAHVIALLRSSDGPVSIDEDRITISFRYNIHKENIEKPENLKVVENLIGKNLGRTCKIFCVCKPNPLIQAALEKGFQITGVEEK